MSRPTLLLTGFEPFLDVKVNASGEIARHLDGVELDGVQVRSAVLPVSFKELPGAYAAALEGLQPIALCSMGVQRSPYFRLESRARPKLESTAPDNLGEFAFDQPPLGESQLVSTADLGSLGRAVLAASPGYVRISEDAGQYLCERCNWEVLSTGVELGIPGVFVHVPPLEAIPVAGQAEIMKALLLDLIRQARQKSG